jgi:ribonuclease HI
MGFLSELEAARQKRAAWQIIVYTDGGCCIKKDKVGAFAWKALYPDGRVRSAVGSMIGTTVNRMELSAIRSALEALPRNQPLLVRSDSMYCVKGLSEWMLVWRAHEWRTMDGKVVKNRDLWVELSKLLRNRSVRFEHVRGHAGDLQNEAVDHMCTEAMKYTHAQHLAGKPVPVDEWDGYAA